MSGHPSAIHLCFQHVKNAGRVALFGIPNSPVPLDLANEVIFKGLRIHNASVGKHHSEGPAAEAMSQGKVKKCDQHDDRCRRKPRMRNGKASIGNPDKSQERRAANSDGE